MEFASLSAHILLHQNPEVREVEAIGDRTQLAVQTSEETLQTTDR